MDVSDPAIEETYKTIRQDSAKYDWALFGYKTPTKLEVAKTGSGWPELLASLPQDKVLYVFARLQTGDDMSHRTKFVLISWVGSKVSVVARAKVSVHKPSIKAVLQGVAVEVHATALEDLRYDDLLDRLTMAGGAAYDSTSGSQIRPNPTPQTHHPHHPPASSASSSHSSTSAKSSTQLGTAAGKPSTAPHSHTGSSGSSSTAHPTSTSANTTAAKAKSSAQGAPSTAGAPSPAAAAGAVSSVNSGPKSKASGLPRPVHELAYGLGHLQGKRSSMEDRDVLIPSMPANEHYAFAAVFDGHGGTEAAQFTADRLPALLDPSNELFTPPADTSTAESKKAIEEMFIKIFSKLDEEFLEECAMNMYESGTTAACVLFNKTTKDLVCINIGDSRAVIGKKGGHADALSVDHKPRLDTEKARIEAAGFKVDAEGRIDGLHSFSRAIGDADMKQDFTRAMGDQAIIVTPEFKWVRWGAESAEDSWDLVIIACDGLWDVMSNNEAVQWVEDKLHQGTSLEDTTKQLVQNAIDIGSTDNVSACIVLLT